MQKMELYLMLVYLGIEFFIYIIINYLLILFLSLVVFNHKVESLIQSFKIHI
jgi:hypothetical protein